MKLIWHVAPFEYTALKPWEGKEMPKNVPPVQWQPLSECRLIHSKLNGKCLSNETESMFHCSKQGLTCSGLWQAIYVSGEEGKKRKAIEGRKSSVLNKIPHFNQFKLSVLQSAFHLVWGFACSLHFLLLTRWTYSISTFVPLMTNLCLTFWLRSRALFGFGPLISDCQHIQYKSTSHSTGSVKNPSLS